MRLDASAALCGASLACFAACAVLGRTVARASCHPVPDLCAAAALRGRYVPLARIFTALGRWPALTVIAIVAATAALVLRTDPRPLALLYASQLASQAVVAALKGVIRRARPAVRPAGRAELDFSYPSGHAATAAVFFGGLLGWVSHLRPASPQSSAIALMLALCCIGLPWSRLALGAHYATDVAGGILFGAGWNGVVFFALSLRCPVTA